MTFLVLHLLSESIRKCIPVHLYIFTISSPSRSRMVFSSPCVRWRFPPFCTADSSDGIRDKQFPSSDWDLKPLFSTKSFIPRLRYPSICTVLLVSSSISSVLLGFWGEIRGIMSSGSPEYSPFFAVMGASAAMVFSGKFCFKYI